MRTRVIGAVSRKLRRKKKPLLIDPDSMIAAQARRAEWSRAKFFVFVSKFSLKFVVFHDFFL